MARNWNPNANNVIFNKSANRNFLKWLAEELEKQEQQEQKKKNETAHHV